MPTISVASLNPAEAINWSNVGLTDEMMHRLSKATSTNALGKSIEAYQGFGSFHSENVEDLMALSDEEYKPPSFMPMFAKRILPACASRYLGIGTCEHRCGGSKCSRKRPRTAESASPALPTPAGDSMCSSDSEGAVCCQESACSCSDSCTEDGCSPTHHHHISELLRAPTEVCAFGEEFHRKHFSITQHMTFINHGAFGSSLVGASAIKRLYEIKMEKEVVEFVDRELLPLVVHSIRTLSRFLHADPRQVVLLQNATFALNCAMNMITAGDVVAYLDTEYLAVYKMMWFRCNTVGATHHEIAISKYLHDDAIMGSDEALTEEICRQLPAGCTTIVIDYVTSTSALCLPLFSHIIPALRARGVSKIIVDAAHAPLQLDIDFNSLPPQSQPSVFAGNLHKWFSAPKAVGFLWVRAEDTENVRSVVLSHGAGDGLLSEFIWDGTRDYGAYLTIPAIVDFWEAQGCERVRKHCSTLLQSVVEMLTKAFRSRKIARSAPFMSLVELPEELQDNYVTAKYIQDVLHDTYNIEVPIKRIEDRYYARLSVFVYNTAQDYAYLREAILSIADTWFHSDERRRMVTEASAALQKPNSAAMTTTADGQKVPCDERVRRMGGCGVSGLDPTLKRKRTKKF